MLSFPEMVRNVAIAGHLHHGKTALMDMLVFETHKLVWDADTPVCLCVKLYILAFFDQCTPDTVYRHAHAIQTA